MAKALYLDSVAGVAGDMFTAAFVDAGLVSVEELNTLVTQLRIAGVEIVAEPVIRATVKATRIDVAIKTHEWKSQIAARKNGHQHHHHHGADTNLVLYDHDVHWHAHYTDIDQLIANSKLDEQTMLLAREIFRLIGEAEADVHGIPLDKTAFHEIGTVDSIVDVVMAAYCITKTAPAQVFATPIKPGRGKITIAHGIHSIPPPASAKLLIGMPVSATPSGIQHEDIELSTPTGIAIIKALDPTFVDEMPSGIVKAVGRGSGTRDLGSYPNVFQISIIDTAVEKVNLPYEQDTVVEIACNIDDDTAEHVAWLCERLLKMGALDVWQTPGTGKKGRSMVCLSVLANGSDLETFSDWILRNGTTFGVRYRKWDRFKLSREFDQREVDGRIVRHKIGRTTTGKKLKEKAEFDDQYFGTDGST